MWPRAVVGIVGALILAARAATWLIDLPGRIVSATIASFGSAIAVLPLVGAMIWMR